MVSLWGRPGLLPPDGRATDWPPLRYSLLNRALRAAVEHFPSFDCDLYYRPAALRQALSTPIRCLRVSRRSLSGNLSRVANGVRPVHQELPVLIWNKLVPRVLM